MTQKVKAILVHLLTATGAAFAMLALIAAVEEKWDLMFLWLVVALFVDGIDGPLARRYHVKSNAPRFDGVLMDLIIDYLTYVFIPAYALFQSGLLGDIQSWFAVITICFASALYFSDTRMKTKDNSFSGFPGCWNMVVLVFFAIRPEEPVVLVTVLALTVVMFVPLKFIHPVRTVRWRPLSLIMMIVWTFCAVWAAWTGFSSEGWVIWGLSVSSLYLALAGIVQQMTTSPLDINRS